VVVILPLVPLVLQKPIFQLRQAIRVFGMLFNSDFHLILNLQADLLTFQQGDIMPQSSTTK
jgi:hypothetical protein